MSVINLNAGALVRYEGRPFKVLSTKAVDAVKVQDLRNNEIRILPLDKLQPWSFSDKTDTEFELSEIDDKGWQEALRRYEILEPYIESGMCDFDTLMGCALRANVDKSTLYRWAERFEETGKISSLVPLKRGRKKGSIYTSNDVESIIQDTIHEVYLTPQKVSVEKTCEEIVRRLRKAEKKVPHKNTLRNRILCVNERRKMAKRQSPKAAQHHFDAHQGTFDAARWPLSIVQIDHTSVDIILVSEEERLPIGRPYITVAIDVCSRMVMGFCLSLEAPSALSVGMCLSQSILPKQEWLSNRGVDAQWPIFGVMDVVHADNAKEFRGEMLQKACKEYIIDLHWRPVGKPQYGAHIERLLGTFNEDIHTLPGTTFSNIQEKGEYDSEKHSAMTFDEFEKWLTTYITKVYHAKYHRGINMSPMAKYEEGILGTDTKLARGLPNIVSDPRKLRLDFMPFEKRTIQKYGILLDDIFYFHDVLRTWVNAKDKSGKKRKFIVRRDPRDVSKIYFWDPELKVYFDIPYRDNSHPSINLWELRLIKKQLRERGYSTVDESLIFRAYEEMHEIKTAAIKQTKKSRRQRASKQIAKRNPVTFVPEQASSMSLEPDELLSDTKILPFDDIDLPGE